MNEKVIVFGMCFVFGAVAAAMFFIGRAFGKSGIDSNTARIEELERRAADHNRELTEEELRARGLIREAAEDNRRAAQLIGGTTADNRRAAELAGRARELIERAEEILQKENID